MIVIPVEAKIQESRVVYPISRDGYPMTQLGYDKPRYPNKPYLTGNRFFT